MELTKRDDQMAKGVAIVAMLMLHLFCRTEKLPYEPLVWVGDIPLIYYLGLFGDLCVPAYCFCSGYAQSVLREKEGAAYGPNRIRRIEKFLVNFWVVLTLFSLVGIVFDKSGAVPGSLGKFLGNALLYRLSYNGAWWFVLTYLMLILLTPFFFKVRKMLPPLLLFLGSGAIYFASYVFRFAWVLRIDNSVLSWIWNQAILLGTSQFSFVIGLLFHRYAIITKLRERLCEKRGTVWLLILAPFAMFFLHCVEVSLIIAPITGM